MPFYRYELAPCPTGTRYTQVGTVPLAGSSKGAIYAAVRGQLSTGTSTSWSLPADDLLRALGHDPTTSAIIIDPTPGRGDEVTMLRLDRVSGYSYADWTPMLFHMTLLKIGHVAPGTAATTKAAFNHDGKPGDRIRTFLYLRGGSNSGSWAWGRSGQVNGPLLWEDAMSHFSDEIARYP